jgi:predicted RNA methylase
MLKMFYNIPMSKQKHLDEKSRIDQGSFYTEDAPRDLLTTFCEKNFLQCETTGDLFNILDSSCGYGSLLNGQMAKIPTMGVYGFDIDETAIEKAREVAEKLPYDFEAPIYLQRNALIGCDAQSYDKTIRDFFKTSCGAELEAATGAFLKTWKLLGDRLLVISNPPYNDTTSQINRETKDKKFSCDETLKSRDMGISFLRSYDKLKAKYVCVYHPLSYLIKESNFKQLKDFAKNYRLQDNFIIPSTMFSDASKTGFPIVGAFYVRTEGGMTYDDIRNTEFKPVDGKSFKLADMRFVTTPKKIGDFDTTFNARKYPYGDEIENPMKYRGFFYNMRDINALRRSATFIGKDPTSGCVGIEKSRDDDILMRYIYIHAFKQVIDKVPYYLRNCDVFHPRGEPNWNGMGDESDIFQSLPETWEYEEHKDFEKMCDYFKDHLKMCSPYAGNLWAYDITYEGDDVYEYDWEVSDNDGKIGSETTYSKRTELEDSSYKYDIDACAEHYAACYFYFLEMAEKAIAGVVGK